MGSIIFMKDTGIVCLLLSGLLLPSVLVSGQNGTDTNVTASTSTSAAVTTAATSGPNQSSSSTMTMATTNPSTKQTTGTTTGSSAAMSTGSGDALMSTVIHSSTTNSDSLSQSTHSASSTSGGSSSSSTQSVSATSGGSASSSTPSPSTTSGGSASHSTLSLSSTSEGGMGNNNATSNSSMDMLNCPSFSCYYSECYSMYKSQNASKCATGQACQLLRSMDMWYNVSCSASCADSCNSTSQTNCSVKCCNSTSCLDKNFDSMMMTTTTVATTTTTATAPPTTTSTTANGNKCHKGTCTGDMCYTNFKNQMQETCLSTMPHCQLKKETSGNGVSWTAGCSNCTGLAACSGTSTPPCVQECCTATKTSCLMLNGTLNVPSFATRGPILHTELIASLLCLLAITLLL